MSVLPHRNEKRDKEPSAEKAMPPLRRVLGITATTKPVEKEPEQAQTSASAEATPSLRQVQEIANSAFDRTKDAAANAPTTSREAWEKADQLRQKAARGQLAKRIGAITDKTASQMRAATATAINASRVGFARAAKIGRESVLPEVARAGARSRERTRPERLKQDWRKLLFWWHAKVGDAAIEKLFFRPTAPALSLDGLTIRSANRAHARDYKATPRLVFDWALAGVPEDFSKFSFVDYGAGRGRVLLLASERPFLAVGGMEFAAEVHDDATMNIAQYPRSRMKCRNVECVLEDVTNLGPLAGEAIHYFFDAFSRDVFAEVLAGLVASYREQPRRLYLILVDQEGGDLVEESGMLKRVELPAAERLRAKLLSPYEIAIYRSLA
jgi:hypothetical protein